MNEDGTTPVLTYAPPPAARRSRLAVGSVVVGAIAVVLGFGGLFLFDFLTREVRNRPTDLDYVPLQILSAAALFLGPPVGMVLAMIAMAKRRRPCRIAGVGFLLNLGVWAVPLAIGLVRNVIRG